MEKAAMVPRHRGGLRSWSVIAFLGPLLYLCLSAPAMSREPLRIFAAASTIAAVNEAVRLFSEQHEVRVVAVFA